MERGGEFLIEINTYAHTQACTRTRAHTQINEWVCNLRITQILHLLHVKLTGRHLNHSHACEPLLGVKLLP